MEWPRTVGVFVIHAIVIHCVFSGKTPIAEVFTTQVFGKSPLSCVEGSDKHSSSIARDVYLRGAVYVIMSITKTWSRLIVAGRVLARAGNG